MCTSSREKYVGDVREEYARIATDHARAQEDKQRLPLADRARQRVQAGLVELRAGEAAASSARACSRTIRSRN